MSIPLHEFREGCRFVGRMIRLTLWNLFLVVIMSVLSVRAEAQRDDVLAEGNGEAITGVALKEA